jgi:hypothetical protein
MTITSNLCSICIRNTKKIKLTPLQCTHLYSYVLWKVHPRTILVKLLKISKKPMFRACTNSKDKWDHFILINDWSSNQVPNWSISVHHLVHIVVTHSGWDLDYGPNLICNSSISSTSTCTPRPLTYNRSLYHQWFPYDAHKEYLKGQLHYEGGCGCGWD